MKILYYYLILYLLCLLQILIKAEILMIAQIFRHTDRYPILQFNSTGFEYSGKPTFKGLLNAEKKGEEFYNKYRIFVESLDIKNIRNIISNVTRNLVTSYSKLKGLLANTKHAKHINFYDIFKKNLIDNNNRKLEIQKFDRENLHEFYFHKNTTIYEIKDSYENTIPKSFPNHSRENNLNETIKSFLSDEDISISRMTKFLTENFDTFIPSEKEVFYFGHFRNKQCSKSILTKFFDSFLFKQVLEFLEKIKDKHGEILKRFYNYLENVENDIYDKNIKKYRTNEYLKLFIISDFIVSSFISELNLSDEEKKVYEDLKVYYSLIIKSINFSSDIVEFLSSKIFEEIIKEINYYEILFNKFDVRVNKQEEESMITNKNNAREINTEKKLNESNMIDELRNKQNYINKIDLEKIKKKLILISSHDTHLSANIWFLGINGNLYDYNFNDELNLILHYEDNELFLEIKYNDRTIVPQFCEKHPKRENICQFESYIDFIKKRIHKEELLNDFCNEVIEKFPEYLERENLIKDDL